MVFTGSGGIQEEVAVQIQGDSSGLDGALGSARGGLLNFKTAVLGAGTALAGLAVGGIAKAISAASRLETAFAEVETLMGSNANAAATYGEEVQRLSTEFAAQGGQVEVVNGLYQTLSAGITETAAATNVMETALKSARAGLSNTETAVDALTTVLNAYNLNADRAESISDILFETVRRGKTRYDELASSIGRIVPISSELGIEFEQVSAAVATLTKNGQSTDEAVTAIRQSMIQLLKPSDTLKGVIEDLGFESGRALIKSEGFAGALQLLQKQATDSGVEMADMFNNVRAMQAVFPLAGEQAQTFREDIRAMGNASGATDEAFNKMADTAEFRFQQAMNELNTVLTDTGNQFLPAATDALNTFSDALDEINKPETQQFISNIAGDFSDMGPNVEDIATAVGDLGGKFGTLNKRLAKDDSFKQTLEDLDTILGGIAWSLRTINDQIENLQEAWSGLPEPVRKGLMDNARKLAMREAGGLQFVRAAEALSSNRGRQVGMGQFEQAPTRNELPAGAVGTGQDEMVVRIDVDGDGELERLIRENAEGVVDRQVDRQRRGAGTQLTR